MMIGYAASVAPVLRYIGGAAVYGCDYATLSTGSGASAILLGKGDPQLFNFAVQGGFVNIELARCGAAVVAVLLQCGVYHVPFMRCAPGLHV